MRRPPPRRCYGIGAAASALTASPSDLKLARPTWEASRCTIHFLVHSRPPPSSAAGGRFRSEPRQPLQRRGGSTATAGPGGAVTYSGPGFSPNDPVDLFERFCGTESEFSGLADA